MSLSAQFFELSDVLFVLCFSSLLCVSFLCYVFSVLKYHTTHLDQDSLEEEILYLKGTSLVI